MITDVTTLIWKEWKEMFLQRGSLRSGIFNIVIVLAVMGIMLPMQNGLEWFTSPAPLAVWAWMPMFLSIGMVTDAFAGERERHTLETLLASRLPDGAILAGKLISSVLYGWGMAVAGLLVGAVTVNLTNPTGRLMFYSPDLFAAAVLLSFLGGVAMSGLGVLVSLRSSTARQAYQRLSLSVMVIFFIPVILLSVLPVEMKNQLDSLLTGLNLAQLVVGFCIFLALADVVLLVACKASFKRTKLVEQV
jgi:ABC-2 type transport system permease protein